jgi:hypothetical protein
VLSVVLTCCERVAGAVSMQSFVDENGRPFIIMRGETDVRRRPYARGFGETIASCVAASFGPHFFFCALLGAHARWQRRRRSACAGWRLTR